jgi:hypothetical protein
MHAADIITVDVEALPELAIQINAATAAAESSARSFVQLVRQAGELLMQAKTMIRHGEWEAWVTANCTIAPRTAQAYMRLHEKLSALPATEAQRVADLPLRDAMKAISTPAAAPKRLPSLVRPHSRTDAERTHAALDASATALRTVCRGLNASLVKRTDIERARAKLQAALVALDALAVEVF